MKAREAHPAFALSTLASRRPSSADRVSGPSHFERPRSRCPRAMGTAVLWSCMVCSAWSSLTGQDAISMQGKDAIVQAWKARSERVRSGRFEWKQTCFYARGSNFSLSAQAEPDPPQDVVFEIPKVVFVFAGAKICYETEQIDLSSRLASKEPGSLYRSTYDTVTSMQFLAQTGTGHPSGIVYGVNRYNDIENLVFRPLILTYRPAGSDSTQVDLKSVDIVSEAADVDGHACTYLTDAPSTSASTLSRSFWLDKSQGYVLVRYASKSNGRPYSQLDVSYSNDTRWGPIPAEWNVTFFLTDGTVANSVKATRTGYEINADLQEDTFRISFPPGAVVDDRRRDVRYLVQPSGQERIITSDEARRGASYEELMRTESGMAGRRDNSGWVVCLVALLLGIAIMIALVRWGRHNTCSP